MSSEKKWTTWKLQNCLNFRLRVVSERFGTSGIDYGLLHEKVRFFSTKCVLSTCLGTQLGRFSVQGAPAII